LNEEITDLRLTQNRHALALQAELATILGAGRDLHSGLRTIEGRNFDGPAKGCRRHRKRHLAVQVGAVALEKFMRPAGQENVEVARRSAVKPGLALAGDA